jgi:group II intron reverse transcriptase/maturase
MSPPEGKMTGKSSPDDVSTRLRRIAELARQAPSMVLTNLAHHIDGDLLREAYRRTRKDGAPGVDGQTAGGFSENLEENLRRLEHQLKTGSYRAPPVRRVHIPKGDGSKTRPIGIPTFEDKVLQRAVCMVMEAVYEQDFMDCSWGFRPGRSPHKALESLWHVLDDFNGGWVLEADIKGFFDTLVHRQLREFLDQRVRDGVIRRAVDKWLAAGVLEFGELSRSELGTPQGGVISPLLANVYLHEVLDKWFVGDIKPRLVGRAELIRYADDFVIVFSSKEDAMRVWDVLPKRFEKYGLTLHPEKTKVIEFLRPPRGGEPSRDEDGRRSFDLLGFTHFWGKSRKGNWVVTRKTMSSRFARALKAITAWCSKHRHESITEQQTALTAKLRGHYGYYGISGNMNALRRFTHEVERIWRGWLNRRSHRARMNWERFGRLLEHYPLPQPVVVNSIFRQKRGR